jgi:hypothetical protein
VRRALTWLAGAVGLAALARLLSRRHATPAAPATAGDDPAVELRRKLAEQRQAAAAPTPEPAEVEEADVPEQVASPDLVDLEERRARVHARAQEAIELMREGGSDDEPGGGAVA